MSLQTQLIGIAFGGAALGIVVNVARPSPISLTTPTLSEAAASVESCESVEQQQTIEVPDALDLHGKRAAAFTDVRSEAEYSAGHVADAVHLPCSSDAPEWLSGIPRAKTVVVYGGNGEAVQVAQALTKGGYLDVRVLRGDFAAWQKAGGASQAGECGACR